MNARTIRKTLTYIFLTAVLAVTIFPIIYTLLASLKDNLEILTEPGRLIPRNPTFDNYITAWDSDDFQVKTQFFNSLLYTGVMLTCNLFVSSLAGFSFAKLKFPFKWVIFACFNFLLFVKLGGISVYATFDVLNLFHLPRNLYTLMLVNLFGVPVANIYLVKSFVEGLPDSVVEAAKIDGCSLWGIFFKIIFPLITPVIATIAVLSFKGSWNDYIMPTIFTLTKPDQRTLMVGLMALKSTGGAATNWAVMLAGTTISMIPVLVAYTVCNKYFVKGITVGAEKG